MILSTDTPLIVEKLFTDLLQVQQRKQLTQETLLFTDSSSQTGCKLNKSGNAVGASRNFRIANIAETPGAAPVVKEAAGNIVVFRILKELTKQE